MEIHLTITGPTRILSAIQGSLIMRSKWGLEGIQPGESIEVSGDGNPLRVAVTAFRSRTGIRLTTRKLALNKYLVSRP